MKKNYISIYFLAALLVVFAIITSCSKDEFVSQPDNLYSENGLVRFGFNISDLWAPDEIGDSAPESGTKSSGVRYTDPIPMDCIEGDGSSTDILIYMIEEDCPPETDTISTKADSDYEFGIYAYQVPTSSVGGATAYSNTFEKIESFMDNVGVDINGTTYAGGPKYWPGASCYLQFYAYAPYFYSSTVEGKTVSSIEGLTIDNSNFLPILKYEVPTDVSKHTDIKDGKADFRIGSNTADVEITLSHILSQIQVQKGSLDEGKILYISFNNIYCKGDRIMATPQKVGENDVEWVIKSDIKNFIQEINMDVSSLTPRQDIGAVMYMLPQTLSDDATIEIKLRVNSTDPNSSDPTNPSSRYNDYILKKQLNDFVGNWEPNKKYTYVISTPEEVEVVVTDEVTVDESGNPVKKNLRIINNGLSTSYIKATIHGVWVIPNGTDKYEDDQVAASWNKEVEGTFVWGSNNNGNEPTNTATKGWYKHTDGYYYHLNPVKSGAETAKLFEKFTLDVLPPIDGAVLDLTIVVQSVLAADVNLAWPNVITDKLKSKPFGENEE